MKLRKRFCDAAVEVLRETNNPAVMWGDTGLIDLISIRAGDRRPDEFPWHAHRRILDALSRTPGILIPKKTIGGNRTVRIFRLPETAVAQ